MPDPREQLASLFAEFFAAGTPRQSYDYADRALAIAHKTYVELRTQPDGLDEIVVAVGGRVVYHVERMTSDLVWSAIYEGGMDDNTRTVLTFSVEGARLEMRAERDGC